MGVEASTGDTGAAGNDDATRREYWALELGHVVQEIGTMWSTRIQALTFLGTANILVLGTALSVSKAGLCLIASAIATLGYVVNSWMQSAQRVLHVRGIVLQRNLSDGEPDTYLQMWHTESARMEEAINEPDASERARKTKALPDYHFRSRTGDALLAIAVVEASGAFLALSPSFAFF
jgi:hypothetical protein